MPLQIQVTGQFISEVGFPTGFNPSKENPEPARVFRYSQIKVLRTGLNKKSAYTTMDCLQKLIGDIELHSVEGIKECFKNGNGNNK